MQKTMRIRFESALWEETEGKKLLYCAIREEMGAGAGTVGRHVVYKIC